MSRYYRHVIKRPVRICYCGECPRCKMAEQYRLAALEFFYDLDRRDDDLEYYDGKTKPVES